MFFPSKNLFFEKIPFVIFPHILRQWTEGRNGVADKEIYHIHSSKFEI